MNDVLENFIDAIARNASLWPTIDVRVVAVKVGGVWQNVCTRLHMRTKAVADCGVLRHQFASEAILGKQYLYPVEELPGLLRRIEQGRLPSPDGDVYFTTTASLSGESPAVRLGVYPRRTKYTYSIGKQRWNGRVVSGSPDSSHNPISAFPGQSEALDRIASHEMERPWDGFREFANHVTGEGGWGQVAGFVELDVQEEVSIEQDSVSCNENVVSFTLVAGATTHAEATRVAVDTGAAGMGAPDKIEIPKLTDWRRADDGLIRCRVTCDIGTAERAELILSCGSRTLEWVEVTRRGMKNQAVPLRAYRLLDPDLRRLREGLAVELPLEKKEKGDARVQVQFEAAVARLLVLAGWQVDWRFGEGLTQGADVIGYSPTHNALLVVECSLTSPDRPGKTGKLLERREALRRQLPEVDLLAVFATSMRRREIPTTVRTSLDLDQVFLWAGEDLDALLGRIEGDLTPAKLLSELKAPRAEAKMIPRVR